MNNLRIVSCHENQFNRNGKGYDFDKRINRYASYITLNSKKIHLGMFDTKEEAHQAYLQAKEKYHIIPEAQDK